MFILRLYCQTSKEGPGNLINCKHIKNLHNLKTKWFTAIIWHIGECDYSLFVEEWYQLSHIIKKTNKSISQNQSLMHNTILNIGLLCVENKWICVNNQDCNKSRQDSATHHTTWGQNKTNTLWLWPLLGHTEQHDVSTRDITSVIDRRVALWQSHCIKAL